MAYDYDTLYRTTPDALGPQTPVFADFFATYARRNARVLDLGCGQGRNALPIARAGHRVVAVDLSPNGIRALADAAAQEGLAIEAVVADISTYDPAGPFDVILIDRTLHMLPRPQRLAVLARLLPRVAPDGWVLIEDEARNIAALSDIFAHDPGDWTTAKRHRGTLFMQRAADQRNG